MNSAAQSEKHGFCPYCGCGCRLKFSCSDGAITKVFQDGDDPISNGKSCIKGLTSHEVLRTGRLKNPQIRPVKSRGLLDCRWEKAYGAIAKKMKELEQYDDNGIQDLIFFVPDGQSSNEFNYIFSKLCRSVYHSNNIDSCARLCHQATTVAFDRLTGLSAIPTYNMDDLQDADCFLMIGTDPAEDYPVMFNRVLDAKKKGAKIISVDVASNSTTELADINIQLPTDGIVPLISYLVRKFIDSDKVSRDSKLFHGFSEFKDSAEKVSQKYPMSFWGLEQEKQEIIFHTLESAKKVAICFGMGVTQHSNGTNNVESIISFGHLINAIVFPNRGKISVQGAGDVGGYPEWDSMKIENDYCGWSDDFRGHKGQWLTKALYDKDVKFIWIVGGDLAQSMPDLNLLDECLRHKFIVYQGHHNSRIMDFASVVLPMAMLPEYEGSVTNGERRVRGVDDCISCEFKSPVDIILEFTKYIGAKGFDFANVKDITDEIINIVPGYQDLSVEKIYSKGGDFADKSPKFHKFNKLKTDFGYSSGNSKYPFTFTTARGKYQFCTGVESGNSTSLVKLSGDQLIFMNTQDMENLRISDGQRIKIISEVGEIESEVYRSSDVLNRTVVGSFHFSKLLVNRLTPVILDPISGTPAYKEVPVRIEVLL